MVQHKTYFVRVKPFNRKRGYLVRNYMHRGVRFTTRWKEVSYAIAEELKAISQPHEREDFLPLFDVKTQTEALEIEAEEKEKVGTKRVPKVKSAERVPDRKFRDDTPKVDEDTGEIVDGNVEVAEKVTAEPAPSLRARRSKTRTRSSSRD